MKILIFHVSDLSPSGIHIHHKYYSKISLSDCLALDWQEKHSWRTWEYFRDIDFVRGAFTAVDVVVEILGPLLPSIHHKSVQTYLPWSYPATKSHLRRVRGFLKLLVVEFSLTVQLNSRKEDISTYAKQ